MADIYTQSGEEIAMGLQSSTVCDEAIRAAKGIARDRGESVRLEDGDDAYDVYPDGMYEAAEPWDEAN